jgi:hypothetical protein
VRAGRVAVRPAAVGFDAARRALRGRQRSPFDVVVLATGFRPGDRRRSRRTSTRPADPAAPGLFVVGARYPALETWLQQLRREAPGVARRVVAERR